MSPHRPTNKWRHTHTLYSGYAPCGSALVITLLQKYRFPLSPSNTTPELTHSLHTPTINEPSAADNSSLLTLSLPLTITSFNHHFHPLVYIHSLSFSRFALSLLVALFFAFHRLKHGSRCRTTKFTISIELSLPESVRAPVGGCVCLLTVSENRIVREGWFA